MLLQKVEDAFGEKLKILLGKAEDAFGKSRSLQIAFQHISLKDVKGRGFPISASLSAILFRSSSAEHFSTVNSYDLLVKDIYKQDKILIYKISLLALSRRKKKGGRFFFSCLVNTTAFILPPN